MPQRSYVVLDAPSNRGLRPPETGSVPGCHKLPWALRDCGLLQALGATDAGVVLPQRYRSQWVAGDGDRNAPAIAAYGGSIANTYVD